MSPRLLFVPALALALLACGELDPALGDARSGVATCAFTDSDPNAEISFTEVRTQVFEARCSCHTIAGGSGQTTGGLDLSDHASIVDVGGALSGEFTVVPGDPCNSVMVQKLTRPPFGARMPFTGVPLDEIRLQIVIDWIAGGAQE